MLARSAQVWPNFGPTSLCGLVEPRWYATPTDGFRFTSTGRPHLRLRADAPAGQRAGGGRASGHAHRGWHCHLQIQARYAALRRRSWARSGPDMRPHPRRVAACTQLVLQVGARLLRVFIDASAPGAGCRAPTASRPTRRWHPPKTASFSTRMTFSQWWAAVTAAARPDAPEPMTSRSQASGARSALVMAGRLGGFMRPAAPAHVGWPPARGARARLHQPSWPASASALQG